MLPCEKRKGNKRPFWKEYEANLIMKITKRVCWIDFRKSEINKKANTLILMAKNASH